MPHQLSSLPAAALLAVFIGITGGTTGVLVFFRLVVLACKAGMSYVFYREFRRDLGKPAALLAALVLFAFVRDRIDERLVPAALRGLPITLVTASLMALAFTGVVGIAGGLFV